MLATHQDAERRYEALRHVALNAAQLDAPAGLRYDAISPAALNAARLWMSVQGRRVDWDWLSGYAAFKFRYPKRFELALWEPAGLLALSLGRPTYEGDHLRLDFLEARPKEFGPRQPVMVHILVAYGIYARLLNARQIRIMHPINEQVRLHYQSFGYTYLAKQDYLFKQVL